MNAYIEYMITKGENFDTTGSQINEILTNPDFDGEEKIEELDIYFSEPKED